MGDISVKISGLEKMIEFSVGLGDSIQEIADEEIERGLIKAEVEARRIVPVRTGFLRSTIGHRRLAVAAFVFEATAYYAVYVEYGTVKMRAQPYMRPALWRVLPEIRMRIKRRFEGMSG